MVDSQTCLLIISLIVEFFAFVLCVFGNFVVCYAMIFKDRLKNSASMYILSTSIADLLVGLIAIPTGGLQAMDHRPHNFEACVILMVTIVAVSGASLTSTLALSVGRFWAICFPFSYRNQNTRRINGIIIAISWTIPILTILPLLLDSGIRSRFEGKCIMTTILNFRIMRIDGISSLIYTALMVLLYYFMYRKLADQQSNTEISRSQKFRADIRIAKTFAIIFGAFVTCWTPLQIIIFTVGYTENGKFFSPWLHTFAICLAHINSAINPFIYAYRISSVRNTLKGIFCCSDSPALESSVRSTS